MILFYSGEENKSLPEYVLKEATIMLTYWLHGRGDKPSSRFRKILDQAEEEIQDTGPSQEIRNTERTKLF